MKTLILHHVEPMWEDGYKRIGGLTFDEVQSKINDHLLDNEYDRIILTRFEDWKIRPEDGYWPELEAQINQVRDYGYGWGWSDAAYHTCANKPNPWDEPCDCFVQGGNHSECVLVADWMRELPKSDVSIAGAFDGECIEDLEIALNHLEIKFERIEDLII